MFIREEIRQLFASYQLNGFNEEDAILYIDFPCIIYGPDTIESIDFEDYN